MPERHRDRNPASCVCFRHHPMQLRLEYFAVCCPGGRRMSRAGTFKVAAVSAVALCCASLPLAGAGAAASSGYSFHGDPSAPDISGLWLGTYTGPPGDRPQLPTVDRDITRWAPWPPPFTPAYQKIADERLAAAKAGRQLGDIGARCLPFGLPWGLTLKVYPDEVIQTPGQVSIWVTGTFPLIIWTESGRIRSGLERPLHRALGRRYAAHRYDRHSGRDAGRCRPPHAAQRQTAHGHDDAARRRRRTARACHPL